ncbi:MAG: kelch repeat-containing protein, partial [Flavobacteriaceae bacterium]|nr:kelch repeat-containing protein [Flavobacteriaceae bacterium]
ASLPPARAYHSAVAVGNTMLVAFGQALPARTVYDDVWRFGFATREWSRVAATGPAPAGRFGGSAVAYGLLAVFFGGINAAGAYTETLAALNTNTSTWLALKELGPAPGPRAHHAATMLGDRMYIFAGVTTGARRVADLHSYSFRLSAWAIVVGHAGVVPARSHFALLSDAVAGDALVIGGHGAVTLMDRYRLHGAAQLNDTHWAINATRLGSALAPPAVNRDVIRAEFAAVRAGAHVALCGGGISPSFPMRLGASCVHYDAQRGENALMQPMPLPTTGSSAVYYGRSMYVFGGQVAYEAIKAAAAVNYLQIMTVAAAQMCAAGAVADAAGCLHCSAGTLNPECAAAQRGWYAPAPYRAAVPCPRGTFSAAVG